MKKDKMVEGFWDCFICNAYSINPDQAVDCRHSIACSFTKSDHSIRSLPTEERINSALMIEQLIDMVFSMLPALKMRTDKPHYSKAIYNDIRGIWKSAFTGFEYGFKHDQLSYVTVMYPFVRVAGYGGYPIITYPFFVEFHTGGKELWIIEAVPTMIDGSESPEGKQAMTFERVNEYSANFDSDVRQSYFFDSPAYNYRLEDVAETENLTCLNGTYILKLVLEHNYSINLNNCEVKRCLTSRGIVAPTKIKKTPNISISFEKGNAVIGVNEQSYPAYRRSAIKSLIKACLFRTVFYSFMHAEEAEQKQANDIFAQAERARFLKKMLNQHKIELSPTTIRNIESYLKNEAQKEAESRAALIGALLGSAAKHFSPD